MAHPWQTIPAADYEGHMGPAGADQLAVLSQAMREVYRAFRPARLAALGCATGNGLEHIDAARTHLAVGIDINPRYLALARRRGAHLGDSLQLICASLEEAPLQTAAFDLVQAALIFEYVRPDLLMSRIADWLAPGGTCAVILQSPSPESGPISPTGCASLARLAEVMRLVAPHELIALARQHGLHPKREREIPLRFGKRFHEIWLKEMSG